MNLGIAGSPFGFKQEDFETVSFRREQIDVLHVSFGHQFKSDHYNSDQPKEHVNAWFRWAVSWYRDHDSKTRDDEMEFRTLGAGLGEHLFNQIARDIAAADIQERPLL
jgi:hypothetical protein